MYKSINSRDDKTLLMTSKDLRKSNVVTKTSFNLRKLWIIMPVMFIGTMYSVSSVNADHSEDVSCHDKGYIDGQNHPFDQGTYGRCANDYYQGFIEGCLSVQGNDRSICESATDT